MARQILNPNSLAPNDKLGDTPWDYTAKLNSMTDELYNLAQSGNNTVYLYSEDDLPNKTATTWAMDQNIPYKLAGSFSTNLQCLPSAGSSLSGDNVGSYTLSFTGSGSMFKGTDVDFYINNINLDPGITNTAFEFNDSVGGTHRFIAETVGVLNCAVYGKFTDMLLAQLNNCNGQNANQGIQFFGASNVIYSISRLALTSSNAAFKGIDMGTSSARIVEFDDLFITGDGGGFGISGLVNSGNIVAGGLARVSGCEFLGAITDLENITVDDIRWSFRDNTPTQDTLADALLYISAGATTTIVTPGVFVKLNATWGTELASQFSADSSGRITWNGERPIKVPIDLTLSLAPVSGANKTIRTRVAVNGVVVANSEEAGRTDSGDSTPIFTPWQTTLQPGDYIEPFVTSDDGKDIVVTTGKQRVN